MIGFKKVDVGIAEEVAWIDESKVVIWESSRYGIVEEEDVGNRVAQFYDKHFCQQEYSFHLN
ncbi:46337_t:CDS:2, partial [Gigaspora margarita]